MISPYEEAIKHQEKNLEDLRNLSHRLEELPLNLHEYGLQKLNSVCFIPAKLYHTNEILVHIGNDYFVERSSFQAKEIADRRIKVQEKMMKEFKNQASSKQKKQKKEEVLDIREPVQAEPADKKAATKVASSESTTTTATPPSILKTSQTKTPPTQSNKEQQEVQKKSQPKVEEQPPADASVKKPISNLQSILEMVEAGNYKIEDYMEDEEEKNNDSDEEDKNIPEIVSKTAEVAQDKQKQSSDSKKEKTQKKQVMFSSEALKLSPEEMLKERDFQTKERLRQMNERAVQLGNTEEEEMTQNQQVKRNENIMDKVKPSQKKEVIPEEEQQEKKVSKFKQRMMEQGKK